MKVLGIDIGGTGIKGGVVDTNKGVLKSDRLRLATPEDPEPDAVAGVVATIAKHFEWDGPIGCTFPGVIKHGIIHTAANLKPAWIGLDGAKVFSDATGCPVEVINDADAAGIAEGTFGAAQDHKGVVILITLGTGIGSAVLIDGELVPNTELGHLQFEGGDAEDYAAESVREAQDLSWKEWGGRVGSYLRYLERLFAPDLFIIGGGVSKKLKQYEGFLDCRTDVVPARLLNLAGIVGASLDAERAHQRRKAIKKHKH